MTTIETATAEQLETALTRRRAADAAAREQAEALELTGVVTDTRPKVISRAAWDRLAPIERAKAARAGRIVD
jgi:hypothetical protein